MNRYNKLNFQPTKEKIFILKTKIVLLFKQGLTPVEITKSIIVSALISIIPVLGLTTLLLTFLSLKRKLNFPIMFALSCVMWPVQIIMIVPFINIGSFIFAVPKTNHTAIEIINSFQKSFFETFSSLAFELLSGFGGWLVTAVPFSVVLYCASIFVIKIFFKSKIQD